jgi:hypothetical protein
MFDNAFRLLDAQKQIIVLVQDKNNGRVITVVDNRSSLLAQRMAGGNKEGMEAFANLLGGGKN